MKADPNSNDLLILAVEAAVRGGSIVLLRNDRCVAAWHGTAAVSRAEYLLFNIAELLANSNVEKLGLDLIAVSNGPGSYTGIRIGIATCLGLAKALNVECIGVPLLAAIAKKHCDLQKCVVGVPVGRDELCWQAFGENGGSSDAPLTGSIDDLILYSAELVDTEILLQHDAFEAVTAAAGFERLKARARNCGRELATAIGFASQYLGSDLDPKYVRNSRFSSNPF